MSLLEIKKLDSFNEDQDVSKGFDIILIHLNYFSGGAKQKGVSRPWWP